MDEPLKYYDNNVFGTQVLLETMRKHGVTRIVFSSTAATYGDQDEMPIRETAVTNPTNTYGATKLAMETMMKWCDRAFGIRFVALRYFNVAGADSTGEIGEDHMPETHLIPLVLQVANGKRDAITVFGDDYQTPDGTCIRDYIHVEDLAKAHVMALDYMAKGGESQVLNCGYGRGFTVREVIDVVKAESGVDFPVQETERRAGDPAALMADNTRIKSVLGWQPDYDDLNTIVRTALAWEKIWQQKKAGH